MPDDIPESLRISFSNPADNITYYGVINLEEPSPGGDGVLQHGVIIHAVHDNGTVAFMEFDLGSNKTNMEEVDEYDTKGAVLFVVAVVLVYGMSIVLLIASHLTRRREKSDNDKQIERYLQDFQIVKEKEAQESYRHLKREIAAKIQWEKDLLRRTQKRTGKKKSKIKNIKIGVRNIKNRHSTCSGETVMAKNGTFGRRVSISMDFKTFEKRYTKLSDANMTLEVFDDDEFHPEYSSSEDVALLTSSSRAQSTLAPASSQTRPRKKVHFFLEDEGPELTTKARDEVVVPRSSALKVRAPLIWTNNDAPSSSTYRYSADIDDIHDDLQMNKITTL